MDGDKPTSPDEKKTPAEDPQKSTADPITSVDSQKIKVDKKTSEDDNKSPKDEPKKEKKDIATLLHHVRVAHELAVNEGLSVHRNLEVDQHSEENVIRTTIREEYWNIFREQISEDPPKLEMAFDLLKEIKKGLDLVMTPNITKLREEVTKVLDIDTLRSQAEEGTIDVMYYAKFILHVIARICAPVRDKYVAKLSKETDIVSIFRGIMELVSLMKFDLMNFSLAVITPDIMANHLAYERETFKDYVTAIGGNLPLTSKWLLKNNAPNKEPQEILHESYVDMLTWDDKEPYPETLFLEEERLRKMKVEYFRITVACTILFLCVGLMPKELHGDDDYKDYFKNFVIILMNESNCDRDVRNFIKNIVVELDAKISSLPGRSEASDPDAQRKLYHETIEQATYSENKIRVVVCTRVKDYLKTSLTLRPSDDEHFPAALVLFKKELNTLRVLFGNVFKHNQLICMDHYRRILAKDNTNPSN